MKCLCYLGMLKEGFSPYSSPVMVISREITEDKRVVMDSRHLNITIAKNNLAYPLVRDTFSVLGNSKHEVLSVLDLKDAFHSLRTFGRFKKILWYFAIFLKHLIYLPKNANGIEYISFNLEIIYKCKLRVFTK